MPGMEITAEKLMSCPLFAGMNTESVNESLRFLSPRRAEYGKGEYLQIRGDAASAFGLIVYGGVALFCDDNSGDRNLAARIGENRVFGESAAFSPGGADMSAVAEEKTGVLWFSASAVTEFILSDIPSGRVFAVNLLRVSAENRRETAEKVAHMGRRTTKNKLLSYLHAQSRRCGSAEFDIPFSRQQLADYLAVERSAMSAVLSNMVRSGELKCRKSHFTLR